MLYKGGITMSPLLYNNGEPYLSSGNWIKQWTLLWVGIEKGYEGCLMTALLILEDI